jgi:ligand-binding sensor domain-containing protein
MNLKDVSITDIQQDLKGNLWIATEKKGVWCYDGKNFTNLTTKDGLSNNSVFLHCSRKKRNCMVWNQRNGFM